MKRLEFKQGTKEWEDARRCRVTATDIAILMTGSEKEVNDLWERKLTGKKLFVTKAMERGMMMEEAARCWATEAHRTFYAPECFIHPDDWLMVSLDGWSEDDKKSIEIKVPVELPETIESYQGYKKAWWQMQTHHAVCSPSSSSLILFAENTDPLEKVIERDESAIAQLLEKGKWFHDHLLSFDPPHPLEPSTIDRSDERWMEIALEFERADIALKQAEIAKEGWRRKLIELSDGQSSRGGGVIVSHIPTKGLIDYKKIPSIKEMGREELDKYRKPNYVKITVTPERQSGKES
jgi:putative phage-type endonuclease